MHTELVDATTGIAEHLIKIWYDSEKPFDGPNEIHNLVRSITDFLKLEGATKVAVEYYAIKNLALKYNVEF